MLLAVFLLVIPVFSVPGAFFSACFVQVPAVFLPRHSDFFIRNLLRFTDAVCRVFSSHTGILGFPERFFCLFCAGSCRVFPPSSRFLSGIFCVLRMLLAVFYQPFRYFSVSEAFFSAGLVQAPAVFFPVIPIFIRHLLRFADAARRVFSSHIGIFGFPERFFCRSCAGARRVFSPSSRFLSGIFCVLRMPLAVFYQPFRHFRVSEAFFSVGLVQVPAVFFPAIPALFPLFLPFPLMENLLLSCFRADFLYESDARVFARA